MITERTAEEENRPGYMKWKCSVRMSLQASTDIPIVSEKVWAKNEEQENTRYRHSELKLSLFFCIVFQPS